MDMMVSAFKRARDGAMTMSALCTLVVSVTDTARSSRPQFLPQLAKEQPPRVAPPHHATAAWPFPMTGSRSLLADIPATLPHPSTPTLRWYAPPMQPSSDTSP